MFELEVHSIVKMLLLFHDAESQMIEKGGFKEWRRGYSLHKPKITAYSRLRSDVQQASKIIENEERYLVKFSDCPYVGKVSRIFYYLFSGEEKPQQVIEMHYYSRSLFDLFVPKYPEPGLKDSQKIAYSRQLLKGVAYLHQKKTLHRDLKPENLLLDRRGGIYLIDFGLSCQLDDEEALKANCGSMCYAAPELLIQRALSVGPGVDVWGLGCVLWLLLTERCYSWYDTAKKLEEDRMKSGHFSPALLTEFKDALLAYDAKQPSPEKKLSYLFWNMLRYNPTDRWSVEQVIDYFDKHFSPEENALIKSTLVEQFKSENQKVPKEKGILDLILLILRPCPENLRERILKVN